MLVLFWRMLMIHPGISTAPSASPSFVNESRAMYVPVRPIPALETSAKTLNFSIKPLLIKGNTNNAIKANMLIKAR